ncbi:iron-containing alcohol dehydrogenase [Leucobacter weissii]|uniref:Iron-containing alcohol dehydrogenase n=1 Tax=Leucobacter weissii TaxID=1983706 RepID=A0A939SBL8_9MICO|nr:iron-containing alcohol dehydrogenase [Leucobacter weissii]MBO1901498.1 iron-containing alcohol dehydrogenase [Leucobacter weissii]
MSAENDNESRLGLLRQPGTVIFGPGQRAHLPRLAAEHGSRVLIVTDARMTTTPEFAELVADFARAGLDAHVYGDVDPELPRENIQRAADRFGSAGIDAVIGLGGGSCLDMAKVTALILARGGDIRDYYGENLVDGPVLPIITVPTTAGTGAEVSCIGVVFDTERGVKVGVASARLEPVATVIDPEFTLTAPAGLTAATGADALSHLVESFTDIAKNPSPEEMQNHLYIGKNLLSDLYCRHGLRLLNSSLERLVADPFDLAARTDTMLAAYCGGMALNTAGTAAAHALQSPIGGLTRTPHGFGVGALLPYVMRFNLPVRISVFSELGRLLGVADPVAGELEQAKAGIERIDGLLAALGVPADLAALGVAEKDLGTIAEQTMLSTRLLANNPRPMNRDDALAVLRRAYAGDRSYWAAE